MDIEVALYESHEGRSCAVICKADICSEFMGSNLNLRQRLWHFAGWDEVAVVLKSDRSYTL